MLKSISTYDKLMKKLTSWGFHIEAESGQRPGCPDSGDLFGFNQFFD